MMRAIFVVFFITIVNSEPDILFVCDSGVPTLSIKSQMVIIAWLMATTTCDTAFVRRSAYPTLFYDPNFNK